MSYAALNNNSDKSSCLLFLTLGPWREQVLIMIVIIDHADYVLCAFVDDRRWSKWQTSDRNCKGFNSRINCCWRLNHPCEDQHQLRYIPKTKCLQFLALSPLRPREQAWKCNLLDMVTVKRLAYPWENLRDSEKRSRKWRSLPRSIKRWWKQETTKHRR